MNENQHLHRVRQDLEAIRSAAGFGQPPLGREDIQVLRFLGCAGLLWAALAPFMGRAPFQAFTLFALAVSLVGVLAYHFKFARSQDRTITRERVYRGSWRLGLFLGLLIGGFYVWAKFIGELKGASFLGATLLFSGALLAILAITDRWRFLFWGWTLPILVLGASAQWMSEQVLAVALGLVVGIGGFGSAGILSWQLRTAQDDAVKGQAT